MGWLILTVVLALLGCSGGGSSDIGSSDNNSEDTGNLGEELDNISSISGSEKITVLEGTWVVNDKGSCILMLSIPNVNGSELNSYLYENELFFPTIVFEGNSITYNSTEHYLDDDCTIKEAQQSQHASGAFQVSENIYKIRQYTSLLPGESSLNLLTPGVTYDSESLLDFDHEFVPIELTVVEATTTLRDETRETRHYFYREANNLYPSNDFMGSFPEIKYEVEGRLPPYFLLNYNTYYVKKEF